MELGRAIEREIIGYGNFSASEHSFLPCKGNFLRFSSTLQKAKQNYSRITLSVIKGILTGSLGYAVKQEMIRYSPMTNVTLPSPRNEQFKPRTAPHVFISPVRIEEIFARYPEGSSTHVPMMLGYKGGLRIGEAFAGTWDDVNFEGSTYAVSRQVQWNEQDKVWYFSAPKYDSYRTIDLDEETMDLLKREKEKAGAGGSVLWGTLYPALCQ